MEVRPWGGHGSPNPVPQRVRPIRRLPGCVGACIGVQVLVGGGAQEGCLEEELFHLTAQGQQKPGLAGSWEGLCRAVSSDKTSGGSHAH